MRRIDTEIIPAQSFFHGRYIHPPDKDPDPFDLLKLLSPQLRRNADCQKVSFPFRGILFTLRFRPFSFRDLSGKTFRQFPSLCCTAENQDIHHTPLSDPLQLHQYTQVPKNENYSPCILHIRIIVLAHFIHISLQASYVFHLTVLSLDDIILHLKNVWN